MPTWVPDDFQLPEGSSIYMATEDIASGGGILGVSLTMTSEHSIKYFSNTFANDGWSISDDSVGFPQVTYIRGKMHVIANVNVDRKNKDLSQITLFFFVEQK